MAARQRPFPDIASSQTIQTLTFGSLVVFQVPGEGTTRFTLTVKRCRGCRQVADYGCVAAGTMGDGYPAASLVDGGAAASEASEASEAREVRD